MSDETKPRITCTRCGGTGMVGPIVVYQGRCFKCDGVGWYYKGESKKRGPNLGEQAAAAQLIRDAAMREAACSDQQRHHTMAHFDWNHRVGKAFQNVPECLVCQQDLLPSEALAIFFAPRDAAAAAEKPPTVSREVIEAARKMWGL